MLLKNNMELISESCGTYPKLTELHSRLLSALYVGGCHSTRDASCEISPNQKPCQPS